MSACCASKQKQLFCCWLFSFCSSLRFGSFALNMILIWFCLLFSDNSLVTSPCSSLFSCVGFVAVFRRIFAMASKMNGQQAFKCWNHTRIIVTNEIKHPIHAQFDSSDTASNCVNAFVLLIPTRCRFDYFVCLLSKPFRQISSSKAIEKQINKNEKEKIRNSIAKHAVTSLNKAQK